MSKLQINESSDEYGYKATLNGKEVYHIFRDGNYWVARDMNYDIIDKDQYRYDLFDRLKMKEV